MSLTRIIGDDKKNVEIINKRNATKNQPLQHKKLSGLNEGTPDVMLVNNPNDERHVVEDARPVRTPIAGVDTPQRPQSPEPPTQLQVGEAVQMLRNNPNDEMVAVNDGININTPRADRNKNSGEPKGLLLRNAPHDEAIVLSRCGSSVGTPVDL